MDRYAKKKVVGWLGIILMLLSCASFATGFIWHAWWYPKNYEYALRLADDSSLPIQKAAFLRNYMKSVESIKGKPRYIFMRPDLELDTQRFILQGLIRRFDDITELDPSKMSYQQGMMQLTGQEMDHQLSRISGVFKSAKFRESFLLFSICTWLIVTFLLGAVICVFIREEML